MYSQNKYQHCPVWFVGHDCEYGDMAPGMRGVTH